VRAFTNLPTRSKLAIAFGVVIALLVVVAAAAYLGLNAVDRMERALFEAGELRTSTNGQRASVLAAVMAPEGEGREASLADVAEYAAGSQTQVVALMDQFHEDAELGDPLRELASQLSDFGRTREREIIPAIRAGRIEEAKVLALGAQQERYLKVRAIERRFSAVARGRIDSLMAWTKGTLVVACVIAILVSLVMVIVLTRLIARPLAEITAVAERIAHGDLEMPVTAIDRSDEVGLLKQAFRRMSGSLNELAGRARQIAAGDLTASVQPHSARDVLGSAFALMADNLRKLIGEVVHASGVLASSTAEISAAMSQIAASASETATAVNQTSTTMAEVKQASASSSQVAEHVSSQVQKVADVSQTGRASMGRVVAGMEGIREHMDSIASSILNLNAQGQTIGEIISSVDDLASQSKMLAINASMEAAKAGEGGKGFAVVAREVKDLAEQSRQATNKVRDILGEIEKATSAAVLTTEQGSKAVDAGVIQSATVGNSIDALADSIAESAQASAGIAAASHQQSIGIDQVSIAMESIQSACAKTAGGARQAEAEAQRLVVLGRKLSQLVASLKV
jgi:methyl-accepting chemotaxis protein